MSRPTILIATTSEGKYRELIHAFDHVPYDFIRLSDLGASIPTPPEVEPTLMGNAIAKAQYYGEKSGYITLSDDTGLFIDALQGWPGIHAARVAPTAEERIQLVLEKMRDIPFEKRTACFRSVLALYNPADKNLFVTEGETKGCILETYDPSETGGFGYDPIFYVPESQKTYAALSLTEKNAVSHRGKAVYRMSHIVHHEFGGRHLIVPIGIILRDGKILMNRRNDPHNAAFHGKWEFPGGGMDFGQTIEENLVREVREEAGYDVRIVRLLGSIEVFPMEKPNGERTQIYLLPYVCAVVGGDGVVNPMEVIESRWFDIDEVLEYDLLAKNKVLYAKLVDEIRRIAPTI